MDNAFEILIYLIIIISFLSSIFKKKKQQQQQKPPVKQTQADGYYQAEVAEPQTQENVEYDILKELEDFFKVGDESPKQKDRVPQEQPEIVKSSDEQMKTDIWKTKTESEHVYDDWERKRQEVSKRVASVDSKVEKQAAMFETSLERKAPDYTSFAFAVRTKFKNPTTLKEYIIISEILGKPKALRR